MHGGGQPLRSAWRHPDPDLWIVEGQGQTLSAQPIAFDQTEFVSLRPPPAVNTIAQTGFVYIPSSCQISTGSNCAVHIVFHGCAQGAGEVGDAVYSKVGFNEWADTNGIIVLYPQL